ncbi:MAG: anthranilate synthase component II [Candidatus Saccharicenans sp.]|nr:MAG: anthranilate/aminodeoxychorismate synthase component II [Candidatus Aminicenantes bacterium]HEK86231.1 aminodeoxychorismate/anthranilate synthase component II [Candidatus Aminicenantes bacterium]
MILILDNFDSFVYNLYQYLSLEGQEVLVRRRNAISLTKIIELKPDYLVISPGPGRPEEARVCNEAIEYFTGQIPILGVCLGHQCIAHVFGAHVVPAKNLIHGRTSSVFHDGQTIFYDLANPLEATRYHSLLVSEENLPEDIEISAYTAEGEIMGLRIKGTKTEGVQFHPESFLTREGKKLINNFIALGEIKNG